MNLALRVPVSVAGLVWANLPLCAQTTEPPPIFAPRMTAPSLSVPPATLEDSPPSLLSNRVRLLVNAASERVLATAKPFEITPPTTDVASRADLLTTPPGAGAIMLPRYVVKSTALRREQVERPDLPPLRPHLVEREGRPGLVTGYTFPLWRSSGGSRELNLNLIDFAGRGVDHAKDFGRVEIEFKIKF